MNINKSLTSKLIESFNKVEENNKEYFQNREPKFEKDKHDRLHNHYIISEDENRYFSLGFRNDSNLPDRIKDECIIVYYDFLNSLLKTTK